MIIKIFFFSFLGMVCNHSSKTVQVIQDTTYLYQHWIHSFEDDQKDKKLITYRPADYSFPPARGREGFEIRKNGVFISHPIAPIDGNSTIEESWVLEKEKLVITGKEGKRSYKIISLTKDKLILQRN